MTSLLPTSTLLTEYAALPDVDARRSPASLQQVFFGGSKRTLAFLPQLYPSSYQTHGVVQFSSLPSAPEHEHANASSLVCG